MINKDDLCEKFIELMNSCGFDINNETIDQPIEYDSLQFVATIVEIENAFNIQIPDEYLMAEGLDTPSDFLNLIIKLISL